MRPAGLPAAARPDDRPAEGRATALPAAAGRAIDWRTLLMLPPKRRYSTAELRRAIPDPPSRTLQMAVVLNIVLLVLVLGLSFGGERRALLVAILSAVGLGTAWALRVAWRDPGSRVVHTVYYAAPLLMGLLLGLAAGPLSLSRASGFAVMSANLAGTLCVWFAIVYRHRFVEMRLAELDERDRAVEMARQLAAAQIQPHFLFNSLASLQHWVATRDERAAPMLEALTGYLRATLPLFSRPVLPLPDELTAVERYLEVMRMRLGERLHSRLDIDPAAARLQVPPGLLLTLVENAVEHGVTPSLRPVTVVVAARRGEAGRWQLEVADDGVGCDPGALGGGLGLANVGLRLRQAYGSAATWTLSGAPGRGCTARIEINDLPGADACPSPP